LPTAGEDAARNPETIGQPIGDAPLLNQLERDAAGPLRREKPDPLPKISAL
jgi:hypothetical protein